MSWFVKKEFSSEETIMIGPFATEQEARMHFACQIEQALDRDGVVSRRDVQAEIDAALSVGCFELCTGNGCSVRLAIAKE